MRELHVYGSVVPVSGRDDKKFQHQGYGGLLMERAERIAIEEHKSTKIAVISGVGTRNYYRKLGYELEGPYMVKSLKEGEYQSVFDTLDGPKIPLDTTAVSDILTKDDSLFISDDDFLREFDKEHGYESCYTLPQLLPEQPKLVSVAG